MRDSEKMGKVTAWQFLWVIWHRCTKIRNNRNWNVGRVLA